MKEQDACVHDKELEGFDIRLNKEKGGLNLQTLAPQSELDLDLVKTILSEYRIYNTDITEGNRSYISCI